MPKTACSSPSGNGGCERRAEDEVAVGHGHRLVAAGQRLVGGRQLGLLALRRACCNGSRTTPVRYARASACSRSTQSSSTSSRPTDRRSSPAGQRSPSQRRRDSIFERVPPRLVVFWITRSGTTRPGWRFRDRRRRSDSPPSPGYRTTVTAGCPAAAAASSAADSDWRREPNRERLQAAKQEPGRVGGRHRAGQAPHVPEAIPQAVVRDDGNPGQEVVVTTQVLGRRMHARRRSRAPSGRMQTGVASVESQTTGAECATAASKSGSVSIGLAGASSQTRSAAAGGAPVWSYSTIRTPHGSVAGRVTAVP